jgi:16S rRNA C967 or C1407 C5-methylase (RsmB/RsmF family)/NOL1/NOP2/fmu family ribosome biogenesis protein
MFPEAFRTRILSQQYIDADSLLHALQEPAPISIRINNDKWKSTPSNSEPVPWCINGFYLQERPSYTPDPLFHSGCYYPQEASGMFLEQVFTQLTGDQGYIKVLDLCGAPGGKSTHLSSLIGSRGLLVSNEVIRPRASILAENITKWGLSNAIVTRNDPSAFIGLTGFFDIILVDAPCSGEGMFRDNIAVSEWSPENALHCSERQKRILMDIWPALKENGILIYSTCTFNPGENEENIKWLTQKHEAQTIEIKISDFKDITEIDLEGIRGYGFYPGKVRGEGLFISILRKTSKAGGMRSGYRPDTDRKISKDEKIIINEWASIPEENLIKTGDDIVSVSGSKNDYFLLTKHLKIIKPGTKILTVKGRNFIPSHEMAMSLLFRKESLPAVSVSLDMALQYLHSENIRVDGAINGWNTISYNGVILGFINNIGNRVNNYYPIEWRIRMNISTAAKDKIIRWKQKIF